MNTTSGRRPFQKKLRDGAVKRAGITGPSLPAIFPHLDSELAFNPIILFCVFLNRYRQFEEG